MKKEANSIVPIILAVLALRIWAWSRSGQSAISVLQAGGMAAVIIFFVILAANLAKKNGKTAA